MSFWSEKIDKLMDGYVAVETARAGAGLGATVPTQRAGMDATPQNSNPQANAHEISNTGGAGQGLPAWAWPLLIAGAVIGGLALVNKS